MRQSSSADVSSSFPDSALGTAHRGLLALGDQSTQLPFWSWTPLWFWVRLAPSAQLWPCLRCSIQTSHGVTPHVAERCDRRMTLPLQSAWQSLAQAYRFRRTDASAPAPAHLQVCAAATDDAPRLRSGCRRRHSPSMLPSLARRESSYHQPPHGEYVDRSRAAIARPTQPPAPAHAPPPGLRLTLTSSYSGERKSACQPQNARIKRIGALP
jgi:hypothetical protein